tara:strand:+ start:36069 stop:36629 length:561 start_codon:yes stop_codon:yes gene_type:complete
MKYTDVMIDIETAGRNPGCAIIQIAAVPFNMNTGVVSKNTFTMSINLEHQFKNKFSYCPNTLRWWKKENYTLFKQLSESKNLYAHVGSEFQKYFKSLKNHKEIRVWGNSNRFDLGIINGWYRRAIGFEFQPFWNTWLERDVRTLSSLKPSIKANMKFKGTKHDAIDDCKHQIRYCHKTIKALKITI